MYYIDKKLQWNARVDKPNPIFACLLQQAIGGVEGEIRVCMQYFVQALGSRGPAKYRDMLLNTATEEIAHTEFLATAVAAPLGHEPDLGFGRPDTFGEKEQSDGTAKGMVNKVKDTVSQIVK